MEFKWSVTLWKAVRTGLLAVLVIVISSGGVDALFNPIIGSLSQYGLPTIVVPVIAAALTIFRNYIKQWLKSLPEVE